MLNQESTGVSKRSTFPFCFLFLASFSTRLPAQQQKLPTLYYIPHTHWEGAVFKTREEYLEIGLPHILQAIALLKKYPDYRFTLDQVAYIRPFLERYPEERADFIRLVREGRLGIVCGMDVMPDDVKPGGELFVRQMLYGKNWCREELGVDVTTGWMLDTFGHHPQMPQLMKLAGFKSFWFCRGVPNDDLPSEFFWRGIDGTEIPAFWLPGFYGLFYGPPKDQPGFNRFFEERYHALDKHAVSSERTGLAGVDVSEPEPYVSPMIDRFNLNPARTFNIRPAIPSDFEAVVEKRKDEPVLSLDLCPIFQGTYSSRIELKQETREIEQELLTAEKLHSIASWLGKRDANDLMQAWEPVLFNQTHDLASGVMTDHVYADVQRGYDFARRSAAQETKTDSELLLKRINTIGGGSPIVVFNPSGWVRTDAVEAIIGFTNVDTYNVRVTDAKGLYVPCEITSAEHNPNGSLLRATVLFISKELPALGYTTYHLTPSPRPTLRLVQPMPAATEVIENEFFRVTIARGTGAITSIYDKTQQWEALSAPANVIAEQEDKGDLWELYHGLNGAQFIAMTDKQPVPNNTNAKLSTDVEGKDAAIIRTPVYSEFKVSHSFGNGSFSTRIRLYSGVRRVDIQTELTNNDKLVRYQALFPTSVSNGRYVQEIPFGAVERPIGVEYPAQNWTDYGDNLHGVTLINHGMPGNLVNSGTLMLSIMRSHTIGGYGFGGGYEPGMTSDSGYELNHPIQFNYALVPHSGRWQDSAVRNGFEFNQPLEIWKTDVHPGILPPSRSMLQISDPNVVVTAFKPGEGHSVILRFYESSGMPAKAVSIHINAAVLSANQVNLMEDEGKRLTVLNNTFKLELRPFEIKTIKLKIAELHINPIRAAQ